MQTYVERDVRTLTNIGALAVFSRFLKLCAGRADQLRHHPLRGAIFENHVVEEMKKAFFHAAERPSLTFYRDSRGAEIDLVIETAGGLLPIEIKAGQTVASDSFEGLDRFTALAGCAGGMLVYGGDETCERRAHLVCSWAGCA